MLQNIAQNVDLVKIAVFFYFVVILGPFFPVTVLAVHCMNFGYEYKLFESLNTVCQTAGINYFA